MTYLTAPLNWRPSPTARFATCLSKPFPRWYEEKRPSRLWITASVQYHPKVLCNSFYFILMQIQSQSKNTTFLQSSVSPIKPIIPLNWHPSLLRLSLPASGQARRGRAFQIPPGSKDSNGTKVSLGAADHLPGYLPLVSHMFFMCK